MKSAGLIVLVALLSAALAIAGYRYFDDTQNSQLFVSEEQNLLAGNRPSAAVSSAGNPDFVKAAAMVTPAVVHVNTQYDAVAGDNSFYGLFGSPQLPAPSRGSGSGVLISPDGYIVTNNHVIDRASAIEVVLPDKRIFKAKLIGSDPNTDLALIKVEERDLPVVALGNSDNVQVGEWVLAVGYPYSLNSTVTAGIISAKGRSIGILSRQSQDNFGDPGQAGGNTAIESFLQTDAAINPGNSGGALVNSDGQLIGINAAIASQTGSYAGYGFAIPVNLMRKIVSDFRKYGEVKRGYLGVNFPAPAVEDQLLRERGINPASVKGVYILGVLPESGAAAAGLQEGDIIKSINGVSVTSSSELSERIARHNPGDKIKLSYMREGRTRSTDVVLQGERAADGIAGNENIESSMLAKLGASFAPLPDRIKQRYRLRAGMYVTEIQRGGFFDLAGIPEGTIITNINGVPVNSVSDMNKAIAATRSNMVRVVGITPDGTGFVFSIPLGA